MPYEADGQPLLGEPMGGLVTLVAALLAPSETTVRGIHIHGGLASYRSALASPFICLPHDAFVPGVLTAGDIDDLAAACAPRPLSIEAAIDAQNRPVKGKELAAAFALTRAAYQKTLTLRDTAATPEELAAWFVRVLTE